MLVPPQEIAFSIAGRSEISYSNVMKKVLVFCISFFIFEEIAFASEIGTVVILRGNATLLHNGKLLNIKSSMVVSEGDYIETKADSFVKVKMKDRNELIIIEKTKLLISRYKGIESNRTVQIELKFGSARHILEKKYDKKYEHYRVSTPAVVATLQGTDFIMEYNKHSGDSIIYAIYGNVIFDQLNKIHSEQNPTSVEAGQFVQLTKNASKFKIIEPKKSWLDKALKMHSPAFRRYVPPPRT